MTPGQTMAGRLEAAADGDFSTRLWRELMREAARDIRGLRDLVATEADCGVAYRTEIGKLKAACVKAIPLLAHYAVIVHDGKALDLSVTMGELLESKP